MLFVGSRVESHGRKPCRTSCLLASARVRCDPRKPAIDEGETQNHLAAFPDARFHPQSGFERPSAFADRRFAPAQIDVGGGFDLDGTRLAFDRES